MLKSISRTEQRARRLVASYAEWRDGSAEEILNPSTPTRVLELINLRTSVAMYMNIAAEILAEPDFASLGQDLQDDVRAIGEELTSGHEEITAAIAPDAVFAQLDHQRKNKLVKGVPIEPQTSDRLRARIRGDLRKQQAPPAGPPVGVGGNNK